MKADEPPHQRLRYTDIFFTYFFYNQTGSTCMCSEHALAFIFSGELTVCNAGREVTVRKGEYIFLCKDTNTILTRKAYGGEPFRSVFMGFSRSFLYKFYCQMDKNIIPAKTRDFHKSIIELPKKPYIESIYVSLLPYLTWNVKPIRPIMKLKLVEAVLALLLTDERFYTCLFDFHLPSMPQKINQSGYLNDN